SSSVLSNGEAMVSNNKFRILCTVGQATIDGASDSSNTVASGFWYVKSRLFSSPPSLVMLSEITEIPISFSLAQNYPNPFNPSTLIKYGLPHDTQVKLEVYNVFGQRVAVLVNEKQKAGYHEIVFQNPALPSGMYFYRIQAGTFTELGTAHPDPLDRRTPLAWRISRMVEWLTSPT
ncbi:MAG: T9SS type A sorting domain-containing protein, partial [Nitrososphaera sp.]|nr:T9SS type A sorting domain-containing protein [Nitrososphaera sp.]